MGDVRELADRATDAFNRHDVATLRDLTADDCTFWSPGGETVRGIEACIAANVMWFEACSDARVTPSKLVVEGDTAIEEGVFNGTHDGTLKTPMGDIPATGKKITGEYVTVTEFRNGKATAQRLYFDRMTLAEQLGMIPAATGA